ncbi:MAG: hypothetical protein CMG00_08265 [Candidatus Marinimicrobia bacterium]|nr:hypothetical protein [Candidatus Neomarinimicrobiota bacterium]|tara:strand:+ start:1300 stop:1638 length:339 start_codon:yes stop_codon:yes gene_type:complete
MVSIEIIAEILKLIATVSILFVWFIRYENIVKEFKDYGYPDWFRDFIGILKISFIFMLHSSTYHVNFFGAIGITFLMLGAVITHIRVRDSLGNTIASIAMLFISLILLYSLL